MNEDMKPYVTFTEGEDCVFSAKLSEEYPYCLSRCMIFPAKFIMIDGKEFVCWVAQEYHYKEDLGAIEHSLYGTNLWFVLYVTVGGEMAGVMKNLAPQTITWMSNNYATYYYDRCAKKHYVNVFDETSEEGNELPDDPGTCGTCGHEFRIRNDFEGDNCSACAAYANGKKQVPNPMSSDCQWEVPDIRDYIKNSRKKLVRNQ